MSLAQSPLTHRQPEVGDFADVASPVVHQDHVLWLHVADDDVVVVAVLQPFGDVGQHAGVEGGKDVQKATKARKRSDNIDNMATAGGLGRSCRDPPDDAS